MFSPYCVNSDPFQTDDVFRGNFPDECRKAIWAKDDQFVLIYCGKLSPRKNPYLILEAISRMNSINREKFFVLLVGDGDLRQYLEMKANQLNIFIKNVGFKNQHKLSHFYHAADLLVLPSKWGETWGLVVNEALHHGLPAIVSDTVGCGADLIVSGETGEIFKNGDSISLAESINKALKLTKNQGIKIKCIKK